MLPAANAAVSDGLLLTDRLIIKYRDGSHAANRLNLLTMGSAHAVVNREGSQMTRRRGNSFGAQGMQLDRMVSLDAARRMARNIADADADADADVEYAEPDLLLRQQQVPNDTSWLAQWNCRAATAGINLPVAVLDTGCRPHADLVGNIRGGCDMVSAAASGNHGDGARRQCVGPG